MNDSHASPVQEKQQFRNGFWPAAGIAAFLLFFINMSTSFFPGTSARFTAICLGLEPRLSPVHPLWMMTTLPARLFPADVSIFVLNLWSAVCGALSVALLFRYINRWIQKRIVLDEGITEKSARSVSLTAAVIASAAFATSAPLMAASTRLHVLSFHILLVLICFNLLQDNVDGKDKWRPFVLAFFCGAGCVETPIFLLLTPFFAVMQLIVLYRRKETTWLRFIGLIAAGLLGGSLYIAAAYQFAGTLGYEIAGYPARRVVIFQMFVSQLAEFKKMVTETGWVWIMLMVYAPWLAIQFEARHGLNSRREVAAIVFHVVLILLVLPVQFNNNVLPWADELPEGRLPVLELLLTAMTVAYLLAFWLLRFFEPVEDVETEDLDEKTGERLKTDQAVRRTSGVLAVGIVLLIGVASFNNIRIASGHGGRFAEKYAASLLEQLDGADWIVTGGMIDTALRLTAWEQGKQIHIIDLPGERNPVQIRRLCQIIENDPALKDKLTAYLNSARLGCASFLQDWLSSDPSAIENIVFYTSPDLLYEAGFQVVTDRLLFKGVTDIEPYKESSLLENHEPFWKAMAEILQGPTEGSSLAALRRILNRHVSMCANNLGVFLEDLGRRKEAYSAYEKALDFDSENFSAMLNRVVLTRRNVNPLDAEKVEIEASEILKKIRGRPDSAQLARLYGYVRVPGEFARQGFVWMYFGRPKLAESSMKRAISITPLSQKTSLLQGLAEIYLMDNNLDESESAFKQILSTFSGNADALLGMVRISILRRDPDSAYEWLEKAADAGVDPVRVNIERARIEILQERYDEAQTRLQEITDYNPNNIDAWACQGNLLLMQNRLIKLEEDVLPRMKAISLDKPRYETALIEAYLNMGKGTKSDLQKAREKFLLALKLKPGSRSVLTEILKIDYALNDKRASEKHAVAMLRLDRNDAMANYLMGSILIERDDFAGAEEHLRRAVSTAPTTSNCNDLAEVLRIQGKLEEAERSAKRALEINPRNAFAYDTLSCILLDSERVTEALDASVKARDLAPEALALKLTAAKILFAQGKKVEARVLLHELKSRKGELSRQQQKELGEISETVKGFSG